MGWFDIFRRSRDPAPDSSLELEGLTDDYWKLYLKGLAVDKAVEFLARSVALSEFRYLRDGKSVPSPWLRLLNVAPNKDDSAPMFWQKVIYELVTKNEVLIVKSDDDQLLIADGFVRKEYALYEDVFEGVTVKGYRFARRFSMCEVLYLQYNNHGLMALVNGLFDDYEKLYHRLNEALARNNQIRATVGVNANARIDDELANKLKSYAGNLFKSFNNKSVAIVPLTSGVDYKELTNTTGTTNLSVDELKKLRQQFDDEIAGIIGIPTALLRGEMANLENSQEVFNLYCLAPLNKKIEAELNAKLISPVNAQKGEVIKVVGLDSPNIFDLANNIDKLIASGAFNVNEIRAQLNFEAREGGDTYVMTKNYQESIEKGDSLDET